VISKRLVQAMGGSEIHVTSSLGAGSTFSFDIVADVSPETPGSSSVMYRTLSRGLSTSAQGSSPVRSGVLSPLQNQSTSPSSPNDKETVVPLLDKAHPPVSSPALRVRQLKRTVMPSNLHGLTSAEQQLLARLRLPRRFFLQK